MDHHDDNDHGQGPEDSSACASRSDREEAAERTATAAGFAGSVLGAVGGPAGATVGGLVAGTAGYLAGYTAARADTSEHGQTAGHSAEIPVHEEGTDQ
ncbi:MAG: hypothetical protein BRD23_00610 [Halobacteriales archaeon SW_9_67_25]|jgi:hypothetical protein|nr:MAG: hypothetical protein BRD23_00610 [Halobacteriales archaeon SW_9_67_25]